MLLANWYEDRKAEIEGWFRTIHAHPETGFEENRTAAFVAARLRGLGLEVTEQIGGTGVVGTLHGSGATKDSPGRCIAFRAELDALPMQEKADVAYASQDAQRFHGCGHDGHMVMAAGMTGTWSPH